MGLSLPKEPDIPQMLWMDFETGGLDPQTSDLIELGFAATDRAGRIIFEYHCKVLPTLPVSPEAAKVNGYTPEKWSQGRALPLEQAAAELKRFVSGETFLPAGWHIPFDLSYYHKYLAPLLPTTKLHYHAFDLMAYGWENISFLPKPHLRDLAVTLNITPIAEHTAGGDVQTMLRCYNELRRRYYSRPDRP